jgi:hypothetical protein
MKSKSKHLKIASSVQALKVLHSEQTRKKRLRKSAAGVLCSPAVWTEDRSKAVCSDYSKPQELQIGLRELEGRAGGTHIKEASEIQEYFEKIYTDGAWAHGNNSTPLSGSGSTLKKTVSTRAAILATIKKHSIKSIVDAPCGDLTWMRALFSEFKKLGVSYLGVDIVRPQIDRLQKEFARNPHVNFQQLNLLDFSTVRPAPDLIFSRQALQHMDARFNLKVLHEWSTSAAKFVLQTSYSQHRERIGSYPPVHGHIYNDNFASPMRKGFHQFIDFQLPPYSLVQPLEQTVIQDSIPVWRWSGGKINQPGAAQMFSTEWLALWKTPLQVQCGARTEAFEDCKLPQANSDPRFMPTVAGSAMDPVVWTKALQALAAQEQQTHHGWQ